MKKYIGTVLPEKQLRYVLKKQGLAVKGDWSLCLKTFILIPWRPGFQECDDGFYSFMTEKPLNPDAVNPAHVCFHRDWFIPKSLKEIE
jgi:hypothetical protein